MGTLIRDGVKIGGTTVYVDSNLSTTSENPVENKIVTSALNEKANTSSLANVATTGSYNDLSNTPTIDNTLSTESTNAVQNKVITESLEDKYPINYDIPISLADWEALGDEKYYDHKNYYIYDAEIPTEETVVYGYHIDPEESDPTAAVTYIKDAIGMTPASMGTTSFNYGSWKDAFFMPKPCMVGSNGKVDYYLEEDDYKKKKDVITITSTPDDELPLSFNSTDTGVVGYRMYGASGGCGEETGNLWDLKPTGEQYGVAFTIENSKITLNGIATTSVNIEQSVSLVAGTYTLKTNANYNIQNGSYCISLYAVKDGVDYGGGIINSQAQTGQVTFTLPYDISDAKLRIRLQKDIDYQNFEIIPVLCRGSEYTPYGYKIPLSISDTDSHQSNYDLFVGDSKLGEDEYLDYQEQKIYKRTENLLKFSDLISAPAGTLPISTGTADYPHVLAMTLKPNTDYTLLSDGTGSSESGSAETRRSVYLERGDIAYSVYINHPVTWTTDSTGQIKIGILSDRQNAQQYINGIAHIWLIEGEQTQGDYIPYYQSVDPPTPLPTISAYKGENTLSSTETVGEVTIYAKSDIDDLSYNGNAMMEWPLIFWKYEPGNIDGEGNFYVSNRKIDNTYNCWCNYDSKNNIISNFYTAIYNGGIYNGKLRSMSGYKLITKTSNNYSNTSTYAINDIVLYNSNMYICITAIETPEEFDNSKWKQIPINGGTTATQEINSAIANNTTSDVEWYIDVWSDRMLINGLLILMSKSLNSQAIFGKGLDTGSSSAKQAYITGSLNDKGMFWGDISAGASGVKVFGMENWYSCAYRRTAGLIGLANGNTAYKMTYGTADGTTANGYNTTGEGYFVDTVARPTTNYVKSCKFGDFGYLPLSTTGGSSSTYYADYWYTNNSVLTFALVGGSSTLGVGAGISSFYLYGTAGLTDWSLAASLTLKPLIE